MPDYPYEYELELKYLLNSELPEGEMDQREREYFTLKTQEEELPDTPDEYPIGMGCGPGEGIRKLNTEEKSNLRDWIAKLKEGSPVTYVPDPDCPYNGKSKIWGLKTEKGNWLGCRDSQGEECLMIFRTRELAEQVQDKGKVDNAHQRIGGNKLNEPPRRDFPTMFFCWFRWMGKERKNVFTLVNHW